MDELRRTARTAGMLYLLLAITAPIGLIYVPGQLFVPGDAAATAQRVAASGGLLRLGIASELFHQVLGIFLVLVLFRLFRAVDERNAMRMVILSLLPVPIVFLTVLGEVAALILVSGAGWLSAFDARQLDALTYLSLRLHGQGIVVASIFWGLWLFPFGICAMRSGFVPRALGILLMVAGTAYVASAATTLLLPQYRQAVGQVAMALEVGELPIIFWLLHRGMRARPSVAPTVAAAG